MLIRSHRGSLDKLRSLVTKEADWTLLVALRLAVLMYRSRSNKRLPRIAATKSVSTYTLAIDGSWLIANPLTAAELRDEIAAWRRLGIQLSVPELAEADD